LSFKSSFSWKSIKTIDSNINSFLSTGDHDVLAKLDKKIIDSISQESNENIMQDNKSSKNDSEMILNNMENQNEHYSGYNQSDVSKSENEDENLDINSNETIELSESKLFKKYDFTFLDFHNNESIKTNNRILFITIKKKVAYDAVFKYSSFLRKKIRCKVKFYEDTNYHFLSYRPDERCNEFLKQNLYLSNIEIDQDDILIAKINKHKIKDFMKLFKSLESSVANSVTSDFIGKLFMNSDETTEEILKANEILLSESFKSMGIEYINEHSCAVSMAPVLLGFQKYNASANLRNGIYSLEKYMRVCDEGRRCDAIYIYGNIIFIIEYKMNVHHKQKGLKYIGDRDYVRHLLKYLLINENDVLKGIDTIGQIGMLFYKDEVKIENGENMNIDELKNEIGPIQPNLKINKKKLKQKHN
jgi:hypothetical protein